MTALDDLPLLLTEATVAEINGVSTSTLRRQVERGDFPEGTHLSPGCLRWHRETVLQNRTADAAEVARLLSVSQGHVYRMVDTGRFPPPDADGKGRKRWRIATVQKWVEENCPVHS